MPETANPLLATGRLSALVAWRTASWRHCLLGMIITLLVGCGGDSSQTGVDPVPPRPLRTMDSLIRRGMWQEAWDLSDAVLETHPDDAEAIAKHVLTLDSAAAIQAYLQTELA